MSRSLYNLFAWSQEYFHAFMLLKYTKRVATCRSMNQGAH